MENAFYSTMMLTPVNFPHELKITLLGVDPETNLRTGENYTNDTNCSWDSIRRSVPLESYHLDECAKSLAKGDQVAIGTGRNPLRLRPTSAQSRLSRI